MTRTKAVDTSAESQVSKAGLALSYQGLVFTSQAFLEGRGGCQQIG